MFKKNNQKLKNFSNLIALEYHHTNYQVDNDSKKKKVASQNCINDFNHRFLIVHHISAKFPKIEGFITPEY